MIFSIGICGLLETHFAIDSKPKAKVRTMQRINHESVPDADGQLVWETYEEAQYAARWNNWKALTENNRKTLGQRQSWIVIGVNADWTRDTDIQTNPNFPTANQLINAAHFVKLKEELMYDTKLDGQPEHIEE